MNKIYIYFQEKPSEDRGFVTAVSIYGLENNLARLNKEATHSIEEEKYPKNLRNDTLQECASVLV